MLLESFGRNWTALQTNSFSFLLTAWRDSDAGSNLVSAAVGVLLSEGIAVLLLKPDGGSVYQFWLCRFDTWSQSVVT